MADSAQLRARLRQRYAGVAQAVKDDRVRALQNAAPVGERGAVKRGVRGSVSPGVDRFRITLEDEEPAAGWTDKGTRPHVIVPRQRRALRWSSGSQVIFARKVNHPGYRGSKWWQNEVTRAKVRDAVRAALRR